VLDPPRSGAIEVLRLMPDEFAERMVYVSCYPGTLARDAAYLVKERGFRLSKIAVMDMFPQTTHVETMALFERN
jgi:23S rRNA (uracil1939-C5)-methyltransferase